MISNLRSDNTLSTPRTWSIKARAIKILHHYAICTVTSEKPTHQVFVEGSTQAFNFFLVSACFCRIFCVGRLSALPSKMVWINSSVLTIPAATGLEINFAIGKRAALNFISRQWWPQFWRFLLSCQTLPTPDAPLVSTRSVTAHFFSFDEGSFM